MNEFQSGRPGDERGFIHKKILGGISTIAGIASNIGIPGAGLVSRGTRALAGGGRQSSTAQKELGAQMKFPPSFTTRPRTLSANVPLSISFPCIWPAIRDPVSGDCILGERKGRDLPGGFDVGEAVMGLYGAGLVPGSMPVDRAVCLKGMQLGNDGICYNKSQISNKQRMWPAGRKPLLTGGDMTAISTAARAGRRLELATKRLQRMGMMKKPSLRRLGPTRHQRLLEAHTK